jgi:hypothetical protein
MLSFNLGGIPTASGAPRQGTAIVSPTTPPEIIRAVIATSQIVAVHLPFQTPRAAAVRQFMHARVLNKNNQKMFYWRRETNNLWTNIALDSRPDAPKLTATPVEAAIALTTVLTQCPDVGNVQLFTDSEPPFTNEITLEDVKAMVFDPIGPSPNDASGPLPPLPAITNDAMLEKVNDLGRKVDELAIVTKRDIVQFQTNVDQKLGYIIDKLDGKTRNVYDLGASPSTQKPGEPGSSRNEMQIDEVDDPATPVRSSRAGGKRRAK